MTVRVTVAVRHVRRGRLGVVTSRSNSVARAWVAVDVIPSGFPESRLIIIHEPDVMHPLGAFPQVQVGDEKSGRAAMLWIYRLAAIPCGDQGVVFIRSATGTLVV